jgi:carbonic anhydrase/acetyltransferase-like protein (isoleucine patch superfamily)
MINYMQKSIILSYHNTTPEIHPEAFIAPGAAIIGDVSIGKHSGIWFGCVLRGDVAYIQIGENTNIQDGSVIHVTRGGHNTIVGSRVTVGHKVLLHGCTIHDDAFIGMGSIILDDVVVEPFSMVAAGSLVTKGKVVKSGELWAGNPAKFWRKLTEEEIKFISISADNYTKHALEYREMI